MWMASGNGSRRMRMFGQVTAAALICMAAVAFGAATSHEIAANTPAATRHLDSQYGCDYGYHEEQQHTCVAVQIPDHAYLNSLGDDWNCERGFERVQNH